MNKNRKEQIILATLSLASKYGLKAVSMSMIAQQVGIKKPSLYNHFSSKDEIVSAMYEFLRKKAVEKTQVDHIDDQTLLQSKNACEILQKMVSNYIEICSNKEMEMFYKVIYSERATNQDSANIMAIESQKMIDKTTEIFKFFEQNKLLDFKNVELSALSFALTIHGLIDFEADKSFGKNGTVKRNLSLINSYIKNFCEEHKLKEKIK